MTRIQMIAGLVNGDARAMEMFYRTYRTRILAQARRMVRDEWESEDVLQDVVWSVHRSAGSFRGEADFDHWVQRVTRNAALMHLRKRKRVPMPMETGDLHARLNEGRPGATTEALAARNIAAARIQASLAQQDDTNRELFHLMDVEGVDKEEAAQRLGLSIPALKSRLHRVRRALRYAADGMSAAA